MNKIVFILPFLSVACANFGQGSGASLHANSSAAISKSPHVLELEKRMREREQARQDQEDRQRVLAEKRKQPSPSSSNSSASFLKMSAYPQQKKMQVAPLTAQGDDLKISDRELYSELLTAYDRNDAFGFHSRMQMFEARFSNSPMFEDALYLAGLMALSEKNYGSALKNFDRITQEHAHGHKAAAALFAKGITLKRMNLPEQARESWAQVKKIYPGSPESLRADAELKILRR